MAPRKRIRGEAQDLIRECVAKSWTPKQIHEVLGERFTGSEVPSLRTVQRYVRDHAPDESGRWGVGDSSGEDAAAILESLAAVAEKSGGRRTTLTKLEADWIARLRTIAPERDPWDTYIDARRYISRQARGDSTEDLDLRYAFRPWRSKSDAARFDATQRARERLDLMFGDDPGIRETSQRMREQYESRRAQADGSRTEQERPSEGERP